MSYGTYIERAWCRECEYVFDGARSGPCPSCGYSSWECGRGFHTNVVGRWYYEGPWWWPWFKKTWVNRGDEFAEASDG